MGEFFRGWKRKIGCVTLLLTLAFICMWISDHNFNYVDVVSHQPRATISEAEIIQASHQISDEPTKAPKVSVHVWMIEFVTSSPDSSDILKDCEARLDSALIEFNSPSASPSGNFATSDTLAALLKDLRSKAQIIIHDEPVRLISSAQTDDWGDAISISATPTVDSGNCVLLSMSAAFGGSRIQTTINVQSEQTLVIAGTTNCCAETKDFQVPLLGQSPIIGRWFTFPLTCTTGNSKRFLLSVTILPGSETPNRPN